MSAVNTKKFLILISAAVIALNIVRCPELLLSPRFFAEEGSTYFSGAYQKSFFENIFSAHYGYYTLFNQIATSCAMLAPLEYAPAVTTLMSLLVQVGISLYVLWGDLPLLDSPWRRTILALAIPLVSWPGHWLTIIGAQCWFGVGTFLLLLSAGRSSNFSCYAVKSGYLLLAGLTGVLSSFMIPAFLWRAVREKSKEFYTYTAILCFCLTVHAGVLVAAVKSASPELAGRFMFNAFETALGKTVVYQFAVPFTGRGFYEQQFLVAIGTKIKAAFEDLFNVHLFIHDLFIIPVMVGLAVILLTGVIIWQNRTMLEVQLIAVALLTVSALSNVCSINSAGGPRYYFIPSMILLTLYIGTKGLKSYKPVAAAIVLLLCTTFAGNGYEFRDIMYSQAYRPEYPEWREELKLWKKNPEYQINIWPTSWKMDLDRSVIRSAKN